MTTPEFTPEQLAAMTRAGLFDAPPAIVEAAQALVRRAHIAAGLMDSVARYLDARSHSTDLAIDLRAEADKLRRANDIARNAVG
jgi:hypothetical protein